MLTTSATPQKQQDLMVFIERKLASDPAVQAVIVIGSIASGLVHPAMGQKKHAAQSMVGGAVAYAAATPEPDLGAVREQAHFRAVGQHLCQHAAGYGFILLADPHRVVIQEAAHPPRLAHRPREASLGYLQLQLQSRIFRG
jgi:hypothetical protein